MRLQQIKKLLHHKRDNQHGEETVYKIFVRHLSDRRLTCRIERNKKPYTIKKQIIQSTNGSETEPFSNEEAEIVNEYMKKCSTFLSIREIQIKIVLRFHPTLVQMVVIKIIISSKF
jgi:mevalonate kinase